MILQREPEEDANNLLTGSVWVNKLKFYHKDTLIAMVTFLNTLYMIIWCLF